MEKNNNVDTTVFMERDEKIDLCFPTTPGFEVIVRMPEEEKKEPRVQCSLPTFTASLSYETVKFGYEIKKEWVHSKARICIKKP